MKSIFKKKYQFIILLLCVFVAIIMIFSDYGIIKRMSLEMQSNELQKEIMQQKQITDSMQIAIDRLRNDTVEIERIAREKYGMSKKNEDVYYIKPKNK
jgi:cell division protein FtsB